MSKYRSQVSLWAYKQVTEGAMTFSCAAHIRQVAANMPVIRAVLNESLIILAVNLRLSYNNVQYPLDGGRLGRLLRFGPESLLMPSASR